MKVLVPAALAVVVLVTACIRTDSTTGREASLPGVLSVMPFSIPKGRIEHWVETRL